MSINEHLWNGIRTYINYFGVGSTITRKGLIMFLSDITDMSSNEIYQAIDTIVRCKLVKTAYLKNSKLGSYYIQKEIPFDMSPAEFIQ
jgi:hypothetical protein